MTTTVRDLLDRASEGARTGPGFFPGYDRLTALRAYAGLCDLSQAGPAGTAPAGQRLRIAERFRLLAEAAGLTRADALAALGPDHEMMSGI